MTLNLHMAMLAILTVGVGWTMMTVGLQKSALEWRNRKRVCPSCGRQITTRVCATCAHLS
jgi:hypothetical protein